MSQDKLRIIAKEFFAKKIVSQVNFCKSINIGAKYFSSWVSNKGGYGLDTLEKIEAALRNYNMLPDKETIISEPVVIQPDKIVEAKVDSQPKKETKKSVEKIIENKTENPKYSPQNKWEEICKIIDPEKLDKLVGLIDRPGFIESIEAMSSMLHAFTKEFEAVNKNIPELATILRIIGYNTNLRSGNRFLLQRNDLLPFSGDFTSTEMEDTVKMINELKRRFELITNISDNEHRLALVSCLADAVNTLILTMKLSSQQMPFASISIFDRELLEYQKTKGLAEQN